MGIINHDVHGYLPNGVAQLLACRKNHQTLMAEDHQDGVGEDHYIYVSGDHQTRVGQVCQTLANEETLVCKAYLERVNFTQWR